MFLGSISDPFGSFERNIKVLLPGYVIYINQSPIENQGDGILDSTKIELKTMFKKLVD